jgi:hypothetical protein
MSWNSSVTVIVLNKLLFKITSKDRLRIGRCCLYAYLDSDADIVSIDARKLGERQDKLIPSKIYSCSPANDSPIHLQRTRQ